MILQKVFSYDELSEKVHAHDGRVFFLSGKTFELANIKEKLGLEDASYARFSGFSENPSLDDLVLALKVFRESNASLIVALGGGTAIDLAKLVKYYACTELDGDEVEPPLPEKSESVELIAIPSTFGTGSESTHFAVLYIKGKKFSVADSSMLPTGYLLDCQLALTLPRTVKGSACLDALCQAIESYWSVSASASSKELAGSAISMIIDNFREYLEGDIEASKQIAIAANLAGQAINITKTTAAHALSYALTSFYGVPHGHAVALCIKNMFNANMSKAKENRFDECCATMEEIYTLLNVHDGNEASQLIYDYMYISGLFPNLSDYRVLSDKEVNKIVNSVNLERLKNHPVTFSPDELGNIFD